MRPITFNPNSPRLSARPAAERAFVVALAKIQQHEKLGNVAFAERLGVSESMWRGTRDGRRPLGFKLLMGGGALVDHRTFNAAQESLIERMASRSSKAA